MATNQPKTQHRRAAVYARYSSDLQKPTSIEDQIRLCREHAVVLGADVVASYDDPAISGAGIMHRPGIRALLAAAKAGQFDLVIAEAQDRLSRSLKDIADIYERLNGAGIDIITLAEGEISELHVGLKGTMNALFLKDLAKKVRRGQRGQVARGRSPGGLAYGYRVVRRFGSDGEPIRGLREIDPDQAEIVQRIFREVVGGKSPRQIAQDLNREGVTTARGGAWNASTIAGNRGRANGILRNRLYLGELAYGKTTNRNDPDTGRRRGSVVAEAEWTKSRDEALRIIDDETFAAAERMRRPTNARPEMHRRPKRLLSGLLACGCCDAPYIIVDSAQYGCAGNKEGRGCRNTHRIAADRLERVVLAGLSEQLLHPDTVSRFVAEFHEAERASRSDQVSGEARRARHLADTEAKIGRLVAAIAAGADVPAIRDELIKLEGERARLKDEIQASADLTVVRLQPHLTERYAACIEDLTAMLGQQPVEPDGEDARRELHRLLRPMIDRIVLHPTGEKGRFRIELDGDLTKILSRSSDAVPRYGVTVASPTGFSRYPATAPAPALNTKIWLEI